ncbi:hypothetical protein BR93DRAFT_971444 [Coniochaeta sp. PMI_546]|nr:hypothetical protein BR93DRAFT_971444 [Coniochaeta sp. PMI_546]
MGVLAITATAVPNPSVADIVPRHLQSRDNFQAWMSDQNITLTTGFYDPSSKLSTRDNIPPECDFANRFGWHYLQWHNLPDGGTACFGYAEPFCGSGLWPDPDWTDLQMAMNILVTKDGWLSKGEQGRWLAQFGLFTSAFHNRDTTLYVGGILLTQGVKASVHYYSRNGDYAQNVRSGC